MACRLQSTASEDGAAADAGLCC